MAEKIFALKHNVTVQDLLSYCFSEEKDLAVILSEFFIKKSTKFHIRNNVLISESYSSHCKSKGLPEDTEYYVLVPIGKLPTGTTWKYFSVPIKFLIEWR